MSSVNPASPAAPSGASPAVHLTDSSAELIARSADFPHVTIDSRAVRAGSLFAAIRGEHFDGHAFLGAAIEKGASALLVDRSKFTSAELSDLSNRHPGVRVFATDHVERTLRDLAAARRSSFRGPVFCVAGSVGKTTTKELLVALFRAHARESGDTDASVLATKGSENGFLGIPLTLLGIGAATKVALIEVGIDDVGAMKQHLELVRPTHSLLTAIGPEHLEKLKDVATVTREEWLAIETPFAAGATVFVQECDPIVRAEGAKIANDARKVRVYSDASGNAVVDGSPTFRLAPLENGDFELHYTFAASKSANGESPKTISQRFHSPLPGRHNVENVALAVSIALHHGVLPATIRNALLEFAPAFGRSDVKTWGASTLYCDYYNANPTSVRAALETFSKMTPKDPAARKFVALADMLELGADEERYHRELASALAGEHNGQRYAGVFLHGPRMKWLETELRATRAAPSIIEWRDTHSDLTNAIVAHFRDGDSLLIKGSRSMKMEEVYTILTASRPAPRA